MMTAGIIIKKVVKDYAKNYLYEKGTEKIIVKRIEKKLQKSYGLKFSQKITNETMIENIRNVLKEELESYNPDTEVNELVTSSLTELLQGQDVILQRLTCLEDVIQELSLMLSSYNNLHLPNTPQKITEDLLAQYLLGESSAASTTLDEWQEEGLLDDMTVKILSKYSFLTSKRNMANSDLVSFIENLKKDIENKELNELKLIVEMTYLLGGPNKTNIGKIDSLISELLMNEEYSKDIHSLLAILHILDRTDKLEVMNPKIQSVLARKMYIETKVQEDEAIRLESLYFAHKLDPSLEFPLDEVQEIIEKARKAGVSGARVKKAIPLRRKIFRFLTGKGYKSNQEIKVTVKNIERLIKRLRKRKFARSTDLLIGELNRLTQELNLISLDLENYRSPLELLDIEELPDLIDDLIEILENPNIRKLPIESRLGVLKCMDNAIHLQNQVALLNSEKLLREGILAISSVHSSVLDLQRSPTKLCELEETLRTVNLPRAPKIDDIKSLPKPKKGKTKKTKITAKRNQN